MSVSPCVGLDESLLHCRAEEQAAPNLSPVKVPSSLPLAFHHGFSSPTFTAKHLAIFLVSEEPRDWACYLFPQNAVPRPR